jgi:hypothetical protein
MSRLYKKLFYALGGLGGALVIRNNIKDSSPKISENISVAVVIPAIDFIALTYTTKTLPAETVSASLAVTISLTSA